MPPLLRQYRRYSLLRKMQAQYFWSVLNLVAQCHCGSCGSTAILLLWVLYSKLTSKVVSSVYIRKLLHLLD